MRDGGVKILKNPLRPIVFEILDLNGFHIRKKSLKKKSFAKIIDIVMKFSALIDCVQTNILCLEYFSIKGPTAG